MKVRLIKAGTSPPAEKEKPPPVEIEIVDTLRSWVHEFKSDKANRPRADFPGTDNTGKTKAPSADA
jgi:hypothetical protein